MNVNNSYKVVIDLIEKGLAVLGALKYQENKMKQTKKANLFNINKQCYSAEWKMLTEIND